MKNCFTVIGKTLSLGKKKLSLDKLKFYTDVCNIFLFLSPVQNLDDQTSNNLSTKSRHYFQPIIRNTTKNKKPSITNQEHQEPRLLS